MDRAAQTTKKEQYLPVTRAMFALQQTDAFEGAMNKRWIRAGAAITAAGLLVATVVWASRSFPVSRVLADPMSLEGERLSRIFPGHNLVCFFTGYEEVGAGLDEKGISSRNLYRNQRGMVAEGEAVAVIVSDGAATDAFRVDEPHAGQHIHIKTNGCFLAFSNVLNITQTTSSDTNRTHYTLEVRRRSEAIAP